MEKEISKEKEILKRIEGLLIQDPQSIAAKTEEEVLALNDPSLSTWYAATIPGANIEAHERIVLAANDSQLSQDFVSQVSKKGQVNIEAHRKIVLAKHDPNDTIWILTYSTLAQKKEYTKWLQENGNLEWNYWCANYAVPYTEDKQGYERAVLNGKSPKWSFKFAKNVKWADKDAHAAVVLESKDPFWNYMFLKKVSGCNQQKHVEIVSEFGDPELQKKLIDYLMNRQLPKETPEKPAKKK